MVDPQTLSIFSDIAGERRFAFALAVAVLSGVVRANIMVYFIMQGALAMLAYLYGALFTAQVLALSLMLGVPFGISLAVGAGWFAGTSDIFYRRLAYLIIAISGLVSLPIFDALR